MNTKIWKWFCISDLFDKPYKGLAYSAQDLMTCDFNHKNAIRYVTRTDTNNGLKGYVVNENFSNIENGNAITIGDTTSTIYYQAKEFICGDHIVILRSKFLNEIRGLFITSLLNKERYRYNYGRAFKKELIRSTKIKLPIDEECNPDWQWIEDYVKKTLVPKLPDKSKSVWEKGFDTKPLLNNKLPLNTKEWKWFRIDKWFDVILTKGDIKADRIEIGTIPLISSGESNNGIVKYVDKEGDGKAEIFSQNTITLDMFCHAYYQPKDFYAVGHGRVNILKPKFKINQYIAMFICSLIDKEIYRFSYGRAVYSSVAKNIKLKLPAIRNAQGEYVPDWQWMEDYIKGLPYSGCL